MLGTYVLVFFKPIVCMNFLAPVENRELGFLEMVQVFVLVLTIYITASQFVKERKKSLLLRGFWSSVILVLGIVVLEEADYGLHYYDFLLGHEPYHSNINGSFRNIHNQGSNNQIFKMVILVAQIICFGLIPLFGFSLGEKAFNKKYAIYFWIISLVTPISSAICNSNFSVELIENLKVSQVFAETRELGYYVLLFVFISEFKGEFGRFTLKKAANNE